MLGLAYGWKGLLRPGRSYLEGGERGNDVVSEGKVRCYLRRSDAARRKARVRTCALEDNLGNVSEAK
jgi:hypothetical protein